MHVVCAPGSTEYLEVLVQLVLQPLLDPLQIHPSLDQPQLASALNQLVRLHHQFLQQLRINILSVSAGMWTKHEPPVSEAVRTNIPSVSADMWTKHEPPVSAANL